MVIELSRAGVDEEKKLSVGDGIAATMMMLESVRSKASASANAPVLRFIFRFSLFLVVFFIYYLFSGKLFMYAESILLLLLVMEMGEVEMKKEPKLDSELLAKAVVRLMKRDIKQIEKGPHSKAMTLEELDKWFDDL